MIKKLIKSKKFSTIHTPFCIIGGGTAGLNLVSQLKHQKGVLKNQIRVFEPSSLHYYQPGFTMVGGGLIKSESTVMETRKLFPSQINFTDLGVKSVIPDKNTIVTEDGQNWTYDQLIIASGMKLDYSKIKGFLLLTIYFF